MKKDGSGVICITDPSASSNDFFKIIFIKEKQNKLCGFVCGYKETQLSK